MLKTDRHLEMPKVGKKKRANVIYFKGSHGIVLVSPVYKTNTIILSCSATSTFLNFHKSSENKVYLLV